MATKRRRRTTAKRRTTAARRPNTTAAAPRRRRRTTRSSNPTVFASSRRRTSPSRRRRSVSRRRSNPSTGGLLAQAAGLAAGITAVGLAQGFVPPIGGMTPIAIAARQAATGFLIGEGMQRFGVMRAYAADVKLAGFALGAGTLINAWVLPLVTGFFRPAPKPVATNGNGNGMQDIVTLPRGEWDDYYGSTPQFRTNPGNGMGGVVTIPRRTTGY